MTAGPFCRRMETEGVKRVKKWRRSLCVALIFLVLVSLAIPAFAYTVPSDTIVYVTDTGTKYHREGCTYLKSKNKMTIQEAERKGYKPCSRCDPDEITDRYHSKYTGQSSGGTKSSDAPKDAPPAKKESNSAFGIGIVMSLFALVFVAPFVIGCAAAVADAVRARKEEKRYAKFYGGLEPEALVEMPPDTEIGPDGLPKVRGVNGWGDKYTCYITPKGKSYHRERGCSKATKKVHVCQVMRAKKPCAKCHPLTTEDLSWYAEYLRIKEIKQRYKIL